MKKLDSKDLRVSRKVKRILEAETSMLADLENNQRGTNMVREAIPRRRETTAESDDLSEMPVLISSFEEEITSSSNGISFFVDGEISTVETNGISPILVAKSPPLLHGINEQDYQNQSKVDLDLGFDDGDGGDRKCNFCPIC